MMSHTKLCLLTAICLIVVSLGASIARRTAMGQDARGPGGQGYYKVTMVARGVAHADARLITLSALDFHRQHVFNETHSSEHFSAKLLEGKAGEKRQVQWMSRIGGGQGPFELRHEFRCTTEVHRPTSAMTRLHQALYTAPQPGEHVAKSPGIDPSHADVTTLALELTAGLTNPLDQLRMLFDFVAGHIHKDPLAGKSLTALDCLHQGRGDALAQSRLLAALLRNRGLPARLVHGLILQKNSEQSPHAWVETWINGFWMPLCPYYRHGGAVPGSYLVFGHGDLALVRAHNVSDLDYAFFVERLTPRNSPGAASTSSWQSFFRRFSLHALPPAEYRLVEFLLLLPLAALVICVYRQLIGLTSFGMFTPALLGLAFREVESWPGVLVFVSILLVGWCLRHLLDRFHLLQVPRSAFMLSLVVLILILTVVIANYRDVAFTRYISLFPMVILTGMIERFWTLETEDGPWASFKTLLATLLMAATISLVVGIPGLVRHLVHYPEAVGLIMAGQLLIGRYTGYRLLELWRFRDLIREQPEQILHEKVTVDALAISDRAAIATTRRTGHESPQCRIHPGS